MTQIYTFLMFTGEAEKAVNLYVSLFPNSRVLEVKRNGEGAANATTLYRFELNGVEYRALDSPPVHAFTFTPSMSLFVECESEAEIDRLYAALHEKAPMPLGSYGFSRKFGWVNDRFGVSWQLNLA
jgi:predicted 3-demethylubiquinone-9 3-methyltransferase (glyoxalase superfamily)